MTVARLQLGLQTAFQELRLLRWLDKGGLSARCPVLMIGVRCPRGLHMALQYLLSGGVYVSDPLISVSLYTTKIYRQLIV